LARPVLLLRSATTPRHVIHDIARGSRTITDTAYTVEQRVNSRRVYMNRYQQ